MNSLRRLICGVDGSEPARRAAATALRLADRLGDRLVLVHVIPARPPMSIATVPVEAHSVGIADMHELNRIEAEAAFASVEPAVLERDAGERVRGVAYGTDVLEVRRFAGVGRRCGEGLVAPVAARIRGVSADERERYVECVGQAGGRERYCRGRGAAGRRLPWPGPVRSAMVGSVSTRLTRLAHGPVVTVPPDPQHAAWHGQANQTPHDDHQT